MGDAMSIAQAERLVETEARIIKLPGGCWRAWLRRRGVVGYGTTRPLAIQDAAVKLVQKMAVGT